MTEETKDNGKTEEAVKPKRKRRTREQIAEDKATASLKKNDKNTPEDKEESFVVMCDDEISIATKAEILNILRSVADEAGQYIKIFRLGKEVSVNISVEIEEVK